MEKNYLDKDKNLEIPPKNIKNNKDFTWEIERNKVMQSQLIKSVVDLKKEIFDYRNLIRWTSFFAIFSILILGLFLFWFFWYFPANWIYNPIYKNSPMNYHGVICYIFITLFILSTLISYMLNIIIFIKLWLLRKIYLPFFILSFFIPILTWLYCMGVIAFMKHNNKINYYEWLKEAKVKKYNKKQNNLKHFK